MSSWYGPVKILNIENKTLSAGKKEDLAAFLPLHESSIRFIHYPDCQQLLIWLPIPGVEYGELRLKDISTGKVVFVCPVADKLSGSIQLIWDTLSVSPGRYRVEIERENTGCHLIEFEKYEAGVTIPPEPVAEVKQEIPEGPVVYRDGFGNIIENEDMKLREKVLKDIAGKFSRRVEYINSGRSGTIIYSEGETRIHFYYEFGGGNCVVYIDIPDPANWERVTQTAIERREDIIQFVAATVHAQQAPSCRVEIREDSILYFSK